MLLFETKNKEILLTFINFWKSFPRVFNFIEINYDKVIFPTFYIGFLNLGISITLQDKS